MEEYGPILKRALALVKRHYPEAHSTRHAAFANTVAYVLTGISGGYGGPSVREHVAGEVLRRRYGRFGVDVTPKQFAEVTKILLDPVGLIFGPIQDSHRVWWHECRDICFDDDPADIPVLERAPGSDN